MATRLSLSGYICSSRLLSIGFGIALSIIALTALKNYRCDEARACELLDGLNEMIASESEGSDLLSEESCLLSDLILELYQFPAIELVIRSAAQDNREISDISSSLFTWCTDRTAERVVLEDYMKRVIHTRSHVFNSGNFHDEMNWLDIYDMEINETYRAWIIEKPRRLKEEIRKKINLFKKINPLQKRQKLLKDNSLILV